MKQTTLEDLFYGSYKVTKLSKPVCTQSEDFRQSKDDNSGDCAFC